MPLRHMKAGNGHKIWLPCVGGIGRITVILGFVSAQVPQSFFFFFLPPGSAALGLQVFRIYRRMSFIRLLPQRPPPLLCSVTG